MRVEVDFTTTDEASGRLRMLELPVVRLDVPVLLTVREVAVPTSFDVPADAGLRSLRTNEGGLSLRRLFGPLVAPDTTATLNASAGPRRRCSAYRLATASFRATLPKRRDCIRRSAPSCGSGPARDRFSAAAHLGRGLASGAPTAIGRRRDVVAFRRTDVAHGGRFGGVGRGIGNSSGGRRQGNRRADAGSLGLGVGRRRSRLRTYHLRGGV